MSLLAFAFLFALLSSCGVQTKSESLDQKINRILKDKKVTIGISIDAGSEHFGYNEHNFFPMLSVVKLPVAIKVLQLVDLGKLKLDQTYFIDADSLNQKTYSPFLKKYAHQKVHITLNEALEWMVCHSDNNITDMLIAIAGGEGQINNIFDKEKIIIINNEDGMHQSWDAQFINQVTPYYASQILKALFEKKLLQPNSTQYLLGLMYQNHTGGNRIKKHLLHKVAVAHRTGTSFTNAQGLIGAVNDIAIVSKDDKVLMYISIFIKNSTETMDDTERIIAEIARTAYKHYYP